MSSLKQQRRGTARWQTNGLSQGGCQLDRTVEERQQAATEERHRGHYPVAWSRMLWMRLAVLLVLGGIAILLTSPAKADELCQSAQIQVIHGMAIFACTTFMNVGAKKAKYAPVFFIPGIILFCGPTYLVHVTNIRLPAAIGTTGAIMLVAGWLILLSASGSIDRPCSRK